MITLRYFAGLRETLGIAVEEAELPADVADIAALSAWLRTRGETWEQALAPGKPVRAAVNQNMANPDTPVRDGDEIAFFPPVTGG